MTEEQYIKQLKEYGYGIKEISLSDITVIGPMGKEIIVSTNVELIFFSPKTGNLKREFRAYKDNIIHLLVSLFGQKKVFSLIDKKDYPQIMPHERTT